MRADPPAVESRASSDLAVRVGSAPPVRTPVLAASGCSPTPPTVVYVQAGDGYVSYGLSGGP